MPQLNKRNVIAGPALSPNPYTLTSLNINSLLVYYLYQCDLLIHINSLLVNYFYQCIKLFIMTSKNHIFCLLVFWNSYFRFLWFVKNILLFLTSCSEFFSAQNCIWTVGVESIQKKILFTWKLEIFNPGYVWDIISNNMLAAGHDHPSKPPPPPVPSTP